MTKTLKKEKKLYMYEVITSKSIYYIDSNKKKLLPKLFGFLITSGDRPISFNKKIFDRELINFTEEGNIK